MVSGISSISGVSTSSSTQSIDTETLALLKKYGLKPTGSKSADLAAIAAAKSQETEASGTTKSTSSTKEAQSAQGSQSPPAGKGESPFASILSQLGIKETGTKDGDIAAITSALTTMQASATSEQDKAKVATIQAQFAQVQNQMNSNPFEASQTQIGAINKKLLVG